jgi:hypothetical protein
MELSIESLLNEVQSIDINQRMTDYDQSHEESLKKIASEIEKLRRARLLQEIQSNLAQWVKQHTFLDRQESAHSAPTKN